MFELKIVRERRQGYGPASHIREAADVYRAFREHFEALDREEFLVVLVDGRNKVIGFNVVSVGTLTASLVHPREVFKPAIVGNAAAIILVHNHPSGDPEPSAEDKALTSRLTQAAELLGIRILDHVVIGDERYASFVALQLL
jgi:DNA repair protein RadC